MSNDFTFLIAFFGIFFGAAIILAVVVFSMQSRNEKIKRNHEIAMEQIQLEKERLSKGIIMVPCKYCGGLVLQSLAECPNCGAKRPISS
jgi:rubrerythrin